MIIRSRWKDYYDYVANTYGGGDPKIVYVRDRIVPLNLAKGPYSGPREEWKEVEVDRMPMDNPSDLIWGQQDFSLRHLIVAGKAYLLYRHSSPLAQSVDIRGFEVRRPEEVAKKIRLKYSWTGKRWLKDTLGWWGKENDALIHLCRVVGAPVFVIRDTKQVYQGGRKVDKIKVTIHGQCPVLSDVGMPNIVPATEMYQNLAYFMGNLMNVSPDKAPPIEVGNESKILNAGFDLRWSFRHRT